jgi:hypothetical protein
VSDRAVSAFLVVAHVVEASSRRGRACITGSRHARGRLCRLIGMIEVVVINWQPGIVTMQVDIVGYRRVRLYRYSTGDGVFRNARA